MEDFEVITIVLMSVQLAITIIIAFAIFWLQLRNEKLRRFEDTLEDRKDISRELNNGRIFLTDVAHELDKFSNGEEEFLPFKELPPFHIANSYYTLAGYEQMTSVPVLQKYWGNNCLDEIFIDEYIPLVHNFLNYCENLTYWMPMQNGGANWAKINRNTAARYSKLTESYLGKNEISILINYLQYTIITRKKEKPRKIKLKSPQKGVYDSLRNNYQED